MKRLVIITVGKTHSGKTTFARNLEQVLDNSIVMDQDNHAEFISLYYKKLQPKKGPNTLKHAISKLIVDYTKENTNFHLIISNSNRSRTGRKYLLEELFPKSAYIRILVHFNIPDDVLKERVTNSKRSTNIFRGSYTSFEEVLKRQQSETFIENVSDPIEGEADFLFEIKDSEEVNFVLEEIIQIEKELMMNQLYVKEMNKLYAEEILSWTYEPPYDLYNNELSEESLQELLNHEYRAVLNHQNEVIGFYCVGTSAQVPIGHQFGAYSKSFPDIGIGMKPTLTGKGNGSVFFSFILDQIQKEHQHPIRLTVAKFNTRAIRLYEKFGFVKKMEFQGSTAEFITMEKEK